MLLNILTEATTELPVEETETAWESFTNALNDNIGLVVVCCTVGALLIAAAVKAFKKRR